MTSSEPVTAYGQRGNALIIVLIMISALAPLAAFAVMQARLDLVAHGQIRAAVEAFYAAESGLEAALSDLNEIPVFTRLLSGPDEKPGTADDQLFPFRLPPPPVSADVSQRYQVRIEPFDASAVDIVSDGFSVGNATHTVAARVKRGGAFLPGAIYASASSVSIVTAGALTVSGFDRGGRDEPQPALAVATEDAAAAARGALTSDAARWIGSGGSPSVGVRKVLAVEPFATAFSGDSSATAIDSVAAGLLGSGVLVSSGSLEVATASGSGVLVVNGNLRVTGELTFSGLMIVLGDVLFDTDSVVHLSGALLQGVGHGQLQCLGGGDINYDSRAIDAVEARFPGRLPRRAVVVGWRDLS